MMALHGDCLAAFISPATTLKHHAPLPFGGHTVVIVPSIRSHERALTVWSKRSNDDGEDADEFLEELYRTVAEQDPEWYDDFVKNILSDEDIPFQPQRLTTSAMEETIGQEKETDIISTLPTTEMVATVQLTPQFDLQKENLSVDDNTVSTPELKVNGDVVIVDQEVHVSELSDANILVMTSQSESIDLKSTNNSLEPEVGQNALVVVYRDFYHKTLRSVPLATLTNELGYDKEEIPYIQPDALDLIVSDGIRKPLRGVPLQWKISQSQYEVLSEDVRIVTSDQAQLLMTSATTTTTTNVNRDTKSDSQDPSSSGQTSRRDTVVPLTNTASSKLNIEDYDAPLDSKEGTIKEDQVKTFDNLEKMGFSQYLPASMEAPKRINNVRGREISPESLVDVESSKRSTVKATNLPGNKIFPPPFEVTSSTSIKEELKPTSHNADDEVDMVVLFMDRNSRKMRSVPLSVVEDLGYRPENILDMYPEALSWIVQDEIEKPRGGIPNDWKRNLDLLQDETDVIRIVPKVEAQLIMESSLEARVAASQLRRSQGDDKQGGKKSVVNEVANSPPGSVRTRTRSKDLQSRDAAQEVLPDDVPRQEKNRSNAAAMKEPTKRIHSGRERRRPETTSRNKIDDDDPPPPRLWPDLATFRDLLRNEADLRLRILGDDWSHAVKEESKWRLGVYKEWLWTLHNGIGEPVVPSRRERERIRRNLNGGVPLHTPAGPVPENRRRSASSQKGSSTPISPDEGARPKRANRPINPRMPKRERDNRSR
jgi:hypothetical protein